jgi:DNA-binding MarR family transcriptional regulator
MGPDDRLTTPGATPMGDEGCPSSRDGFEDELGWGLGVAGTEFRRWATEAVAVVPGGLRGYLILAAIAEDRPPSQLALAQSLGFDKSAMTSLVDGLETANLLDRRPDPSDRRARQLVITPTGIDALSRARVRLDVAEQRLLSPLDESEVSAFRSMLARVAQSALQGRTPDDFCADDDG